MVDRLAADRGRAAQDNQILAAAKDDAALLVSLRFTRKPGMHYSSRSIHLSNLLNEHRQSKPSKKAARLEREDEG